MNSGTVFLGESNIRKKLCHIGQTLSPDGLSPIPCLSTPAPYAPLKIVNSLPIATTFLECAPLGGQGQASILTLCRAW